MTAYRPTILAAWLLTLATLPAFAQPPERETRKPPAPVESQVRAGLEEAMRLRLQGRAEEAQRRLDALGKRFPDQPPLQFLAGARQTEGQRADVRANQIARERGFLGALQEVDRAATIPGRDVAFPSDWNDRVARRRSDTAPTAAERKILAALDTPTFARFPNTRLEDLVNHLATVTGLPIILDQASLNDNGLTYNSPVVFEVKERLAARTVLRATLRMLGLTYVVREGLILVVTPDRAREYLVTKTYVLGDLVQPIGNPWFPVGDPWQEAFNVAAVLEMIVTQIDPDSWENRGGFGTIRYYPPTRALIIRQSAEVHMRLRGSLAR